MGYHRCPSNPPSAFKSQDLTVAFRSVGAGAPLVLLHGFLCDSRAWRRQLEDLADDFRLIAWDAPGAGESSDPPDTFTITDWADCLAGFLDAVGVREANIVGLSWGGLLAQEFYRLYPSRVLRLILAGTYAGWLGSLGPDVARERLTRCEQESHLPPDEFVAKWVPVEFFHDASVDLAQEMANVVSSFHPAGFRLMAKSLAEADTTAVLEQIAVPVHAPVGRGGSPLPRRCGRALCQRHTWRRTGIDPRGRAYQQHGAARAV